MKFHRIDIKNINSLYGDNSIDIDGKFADTPLYLIMGPTGSGKTTILDAVCLALFGTTPRQEGADGGAAGVGAQVNSRGTGRSRARVVFSLLDPEQGERTRYRATWEFWRAHDKAHATPQRPRRELEQLDEDGEWRPIVSSTKEKEYEEAFEQVLDGMSLQDFLRSVMLAQGEFSALLKADEEKKASILERLTDTGDYQRLGRLAHERWKKERDELASLEQQIENFDGASAEQIAATERRVDERNQTRQKLADWKTQAAKRREWLERHVHLHNDLDAAKESRQEAKAEREEHADDFDRREADRLASAGREPLEAVRRLKGDIEEFDEKLPKLEETKTEQQQALAEAQKKEEAAAEKLEQAEEALEEIQPEIDAAKEIKGDLKNARKRVDELDEKAKDKREALSEAKASLEEAKQKLDEATEKKKTATEKLDALADDEGLAEQLPALGTEYESLQKDEAELERAAKKVENLEDEIARIAEKLQRLEEKLTERKEAIAPLKEAASAARATLAEQLGGAEMPRERYDEIGEAMQDVRRRKKALQGLEKRLKQLADKRKERNELNEARAEADAETEELDEALKALEERRDSAQKRVDDHQDEIDRLDQKLLAAELRRTLREGDACPVCGGADHPRIDDYGDDALDEQERRDQEARDDLVATVEEEKAEVEKLDEQLEALTDDRGELADKLTRLDTRIEAIDEAIEELADAVTGAAKEVGGAVAEIDFDDGIPREALDPANSEFDERLQELEQQKSALADAQDAVQDADERLEESTEALESLDDERKDLERTLENKRENKEAASDELERLREEFGVASRRLSGRLEKAGLDVARGADGPDFEAALEAGAERLEAYKEAKAAAMKAQEAFTAAENAHTRAETKHEHAEQNLEAATEERDELVERVSSLEEKLAARLDGDDPDEVEEQHNEAIRAARKARDEHNEARQKAEMAAQTAKDALEHARTQREKLDVKLAAANEDLEAAIAEMEGMSTVEEVDAALLDDEERERIEKLCGEIETTLRDANRDIEKLEGELEEHGEEKPDDFTPEDYTLEVLRACERQLDEAVAAYDKKLGALEKELEQMRARRDKFDDLLEARDAKQAEFDEWNELNNIIGVRDGERFKRFAQALNLDRIVERANRRLKELHPRYRLQTKHDDASGLPTLDFTIVDNYHAGKPRDLSTLSGGETFLVSLALALALADQQELQMPIETLFLDEGFGTLDKNSLRKAIDILNDLRARAGRTVGVISHVEALQERIDSQVIVQPEQEGRSSVVLKQQ